MRQLQQHVRVFVTERISYRVIEETMENYHEQWKLGIRHKATISCLCGTFLFGLSELEVFEPKKKCPHVHQEYRANLGLFAAPVAITSASWVSGDSQLDS